MSAYPLARPWRRTWFPSPSRREYLDSLPPVELDLAAEDLRPGIGPRAIAAAIGFAMGLLSAAEPCSMCGADDPCEVGFFALSRGGWGVVEAVLCVPCAEAWWVGAEKGRLGGEEKRGFEELQNEGGES